MTILQILGLVGPLLAQLSGLVSKALAAHATNDQATLDTLLDQAGAMADAFKPTGA